MSEKEQRKALATKALAEMLGRLKSRNCVSCNEPVENYTEEGRCVYAEPCGHRQYQGRAPEDVDHDTEMAEKEWAKPLPK